MRKIVSAFVCVLLFGMLSGPVFAGADAVCEPLKGDKNSKGLFGLCVAYYNAGNDNARARIRENYIRKSGGDDVPGLKPEPDPDPEASCPCWGEVELLEATCNHVLTYSAAERAIFDENFISFFNFATSCWYSNSYLGISIVLPTSLDESLTCQAGIDALVNGTLLDMCP